MNAGSGGPRPGGGARPQRSRSNAQRRSWNRQGHGSRGRTALIRRAG